MPVRLTLDSVATPDALVVAEPTEVPFRVKLMLFALTAELSEVFVNVPVSVVVPPKVPLAADTVSVVGAITVTVWLDESELGA